MRQLLTIFHYELLMQFKSVRFKATCLLAGFVAFAYYADCVQFQEIQKLSETVLDFEAFPMYLIAISFTGLFAIGRIRSSGMHPVLMTKPFPTFALLLAQLLAGLAALLPPLIILYFPAGLILRWRYGMEFPIPPLLHVMLFFMLPLICSVLALTIWVRTCFKNNLIAIIILGAMFVACGIFSDRLLTSPNEGQGSQRTHRFVPMLSYFSKTFWNGRMRVFQQPKIVFTRQEDWINLGASLLYCNIFLILGGYHLRRTEPQRKVLGHYGRRWYHAPTFMRMACDLKIDPNVTWRHHLVLLGMIGLIGMRTVWPMLPGRQAMVTTAAGTSVKFSQQDFPEEKILRVRVHGDVQVMRPERYESELTITVNGDTSGTTAILRPYARFAYDIQSIMVDGRPVKHTRASYYLIDGKELKPYADGQRHQMKIVATRSTVQDEESMVQSLEGTSLRGYYFIERKKSGAGASDESTATFDHNITGQPWPVRLTMIKPATAQFICAPVEPQIHQEGKFTRYEFNAAPEHNQLIYWHYIYFALAADYAIIDSPSRRLHFTMAVPKTYADAGRQLMDLATPVLEEFYALNRLEPKRKVIYLSPMDHPDNIMMLNEIRRFHYIYRSRSYLFQNEREQWMKDLKVFEESLLSRIIIQAGGIPYRLADYFAFMKANMFKGLNQRITLERKYEPPEFTPVNSHLDAKGASGLENKSRAECLQARSEWPVFQMLYLVLGHERWMDMLQRLRGKQVGENLPDEALRQAAREAAGESLDWFFDYWLKDGKDLPSYKIESATAKSFTDDEDKAQYDVKVVVENLGSGRMPVPLRVLTSKGFAEEKIWINAGQKVTWTVRCKDMPTRAVVDPDGWILTKPYWVEKNRTWISTAEMAVKID